MIEKFPEKHYFNNHKEYYLGFREAFDLVCREFDIRKQEKIAKEKFFIGDYNKSFNENQFMQSACELSVGCYYVKNPDLVIEPEVKLNRPDSDKDVDWQIRYKGFTFNLEVKCSDENEFFLENQVIDGAGKDKILKLIFSGRVPLPNYAKEIFKEIASQANTGLIIPKHTDNRMKDYLVEANEKVGKHPDTNTLNVLIVACGHFANMQEWHGYLYANEGLFTSSSFWDRDSYKNVDGVLLTTLRYNHQHNFARRKESWDLSSSFNIFFRNPNSRSNIQPEIIQAFLDITPNYTDEFLAFAPIATTDVPSNDSSAFPITHFCRAALSQENRDYYWPNSPYHESNEGNA